VLRALLLLALLAAPVLARVPLDLADLDTAGLASSPCALDLTGTVLALPALDLGRRPRTLTLGMDLDLLQARGYHWDSKGKVLSLPDLEISRLLLAAPPFDMAGQVLSLPSLETSRLPKARDSFDLNGRILALEALDCKRMRLQPFSFELDRVVLSESGHLRRLPVDPSDLDL
jgi:hypothetical protein